MLSRGRHRRRLYGADLLRRGPPPGAFGDFEWSLDAPEAFPWGPIAPATSEDARFAPYATRVERGGRGLCRVHRCARQWRADRQRGASGDRRALRDRSGGMDAYWLDPRCARRRLDRGAPRQAYGAVVGHRGAERPFTNKSWEESTGTRSGTRTWLAGNKGQLPNEKAYLRELETRIKERYGVTSVDGARSAALQSCLVSWRPRAAAQEVSPISSVGTSPQNPTKRHKTAWGGMGIVGACQSRCRASLTSISRSSYGPSC